MNTILIRRQPARTLLIAPFAAAILAIAPSTSPAQQWPPDDDDYQFWNDVTFTHGITKKFAVTAGTTLWYGGNVSTLYEKRLALGASYKLTKRLTVAGNMTFMATRNAAGIFRREYRPAVNATYKQPVGKFTLTHRSQYEQRYRRGRDSYRYRALFGADHPFTAFGKGAKVFANNESYYDSLADRCTRNNFQVGITKPVHRNISFDVYYFVQGDNFVRPRLINGIGTTLRFKTGK